MQNNDDDTSQTEPSLIDTTDELMPDIFFPIDLKKRTKKSINPKTRQYKVESQKQPSNESLIEQDNILAEQFLSGTRQSNKNRKVIGTTHHLFYFPLKLKNSKNTCFFLFNYPFICIYTVDSNYPEIEVFPRSVTIIVEGKTLIIGDNSNSKKYQIKLEKEKIDLILQNDKVSPLAYYIKCHLIVPELTPTYLINEFYYPFIYNTHLLLSIENCNLNIDNPEFLLYWVIAGEYAFEPLFVYLFKKDFKYALSPDKCFKKESFVIQASAAIFRNDHDFINFVDNISNMKKITIDRYLNELSKLPFSQYSMLMIHLLYKTAIELYNLPAHAYHLIGTFLYKAGVAPNLKNGKKNTELARLHKFNYASVPLEKLAAFEKILSNFEDYPIYFEDPVFDDTNFEAFTNIEKMIDLTNPTFLESVRNTKSIQSELHLNSFIG
ncbi:hypothetical protein M9Y10_011598 [Tritrichomonas musculus]|uniref:Uncharacterized protein n=1 Tax=Tritrichomonas musculus TaxID=1915356 RepID=A0ABR2IJS7_9EUKA